MWANLSETLGVSAVASGTPQPAKLANRALALSRATSGSIAKANGRQDAFRFIHIVGWQYIKVIWAYELA